MRSIRQGRGWACLTLTSLSTFTFQANCTDKSVVRAKLAYAAVQGVTSVFSGPLLPFSAVFPTDSITVAVSQGLECGTSAPRVSNTALPPLVSYVWAANDGSGRLAVALWQNSSTPTNPGQSTTQYIDISIVITSVGESASTGVRANEFVGVDMLSQSVFALPGSNVTALPGRGQGAHQVSLDFPGVPVSDWPTLVVSRTLIG